MLVDTNARMRCGWFSIIGGLCRVLLGLTILTAGCGKSNPNRLAIFGKVTAANEGPISGSITFIPKEGSHGPAAMTALDHGEYRFNDRNGPIAGPHWVIVRRASTKPRLPTADRSEPKSSADEVLKGALKTEWRVAVDVKESTSYDLSLPP